MNKVILIARLTKDAELRFSNKVEATAYCSFTVAVDNGFGDKKTTSFISCKAFGKTAEFVAQYFQKGSMIALEGNLKTGSYDKNGSKIYTTDVMVERVEFCGSKKDQQGDAAEPELRNNLDTPIAFGDDDDSGELPF